MSSRTSRTPSRGDNVSRTGSAHSRGPRSNSAGGSEIAFGSVTPTRRKWESHSFVGETPSPGRRATPLHVATIDEVCCLDSVTIGGPSGSVRLERCVTPGNLRTMAGGHGSRHSTPFALQEPVLIVIENGYVEVKKALPPNEGIASVPIDSIHKVDLTTGGVACAGRGGLELLFTIHNTHKQNMLYKLLHAKTKGAIPLTPAEVSEVRHQSHAGLKAPTMTSAAVPLVRDTSVRARIRTLDGNTPRLNNTAPPPADAAPGGAGAGGGADDRQSRKEILYAQLREIRQREAARAVVK
jgi:hypothetical protein